MIVWLIRKHNKYFFPLGDISVGEGVKRFVVSKAVSVVQPGFH